MTRGCTLRGRSSALLLMSLLALLLSGGAWATTYRHLSLTEMLDRAEIAFLGTVSSVSVEERQGEPWTVVEFAVERDVAGPAAEGRRELAFLGGDLATGRLRVELMPSFEVGQRVLILAYLDQYISPIVGFDQGLWRLGGDGLLDTRGRRLSLDDEGRLTEDGARVEVDLLLDALERELEGRQ